MTSPLVWHEESVEDFTELALHIRADNSIDVTGNARIHLGSIDLSSPNPRGGGLGFAVPELTFGVSIRSDTHRRDQSPLPPSLHRLPVYCDRAGIDLNAIRIEFTSRLPEHRGLGSTTQYLIAILQGCLAFRDRPLLSIHELAMIGIGAESSLGIRLAFDRRAVLDLGAITAPTSSTPYSIRKPRRGAVRISLPSDWRALVAWPHHVSGLEDIEDSAFWDKTLPVSETRTDTATKSILTQIIPGVIDENFDTFNQGLRLLNQSSSKPEEWGIQPPQVLLKANQITAMGYAPLLSSVGPALVIFGSSEASLTSASALFQQDRSHWCHVISSLGGGASA